MFKFKTRLLKYSDKSFKKKFADLIYEDRKSTNEINLTVSKIIKKIRDTGDVGLNFYVKKFDKIKFNKIRELFISKDILKDAYNRLKINEKKALKIAAERIKEFHKHQIPKNIKYKDSINVRLGLTYSPLDSAGFYVPGGKAIYPSSVLMNAIPALVAGVNRRVIVSPISDLKKSSIVLAAAHVANVTEFICMGGAHAIAALSYGTKTILPVDKIVGPGNAYVAEAKRQVFGKVGIDSIAGPSEVLILCDETADPDHVAIDLLSQAEHDELAQAILITTSKEIATNVKNSVEKFITKLSRSKIAISSWNDFGAIILVENLNQAIELINVKAPEHLQLILKNTKKVIKEVKNAGAIFVGPHTPESVGDYIAGPNHVLPTNGTAKFSSGLSVLDFYKRTTVVNFNKNNLNELGKHIITLAEAEGLEAHAKSISIRLNKNLLHKNLD